MMKDLAISRNEGIDLIQDIHDSAERGTIGVDVQSLCKRCKQYIDKNTKIKILKENSDGN